MDNRIPLRRPGAEVGDRHEIHAEFGPDPIDLYGRHHDVIHAEADVAVTKVSDGLHLDGPDDEELAVEDWTLDLKRYAGRTLPNEIPMQVFREGTEPVRPADEGDGVDPRWRGLD